MNGLENRHSGFNDRADIINLSYREQNLIENDWRFGGPVDKFTNHEPTEIEMENYAAAMGELSDIKLVLSERLKNHRGFQKLYKQAQKKKLLTNN
jgi:hypothetical protein